MVFTVIVLFFFILCEKKTAKRGEKDHSGSVSPRFAQVL